MTIITIRNKKYQDQNKYNHNYYCLITILMAIIARTNSIIIMATKITIVIKVINIEFNGYINNNNYN